MKSSRPPALSTAGREGGIAGAAGPVDGPAIFNNVKGCHISVAAQQLQVRGTTDSEFAVYSANKPTIEHSTGLASPSIFCCPVERPSADLWLCAVPSVILSSVKQLGWGQGRAWSVCKIQENLRDAHKPADAVQSCASHVGWEHTLV